MERQTLIASESEFEQLYCQTAALDWSRFRLAVFNVAEQLVDVNVVADAEQINVVVQTEPELCNQAVGSQLTVLIPRHPTPVVLLLRPLSTPPPDCADGYGY
jgi:hypothetical protein